MITGIHLSQQIYHIWNMKCIVSQIKLTHIYAKCPLLACLSYTFPGIRYFWTIMFNNVLNLPLTVIFLLLRVFWFSYVKLSYLTSNDIVLVAFWGKWKGSRWEKLAEKQVGKEHSKKKNEKRLGKKKENRLEKGYLKVKSWTRKRKTGSLFFTNHIFKESMCPAIWEEEREYLLSPPVSPFHSPSVFLSPHFSILLLFLLNNTIISALCQINVL